MEFAISYSHYVNHVMQNHMRNKMKLSKRLCDESRQSYGRVVPRCSRRTQKIKI